MATDDHSRGMEKWMIMTLVSSGGAQKRDGAIVGRARRGSAIISGAWRDYCRQSIAGLLSAEHSRTIVGGARLDH